MGGGQSGVRGGEKEHYSSCNNRLQGSFSVRLLLCRTPGQAAAAAASRRRAPPLPGSAVSQAARALRLQQYPGSLSSALVRPGWVEAGRKRPGPCASNQQPGNHQGHSALVSLMEAGPFG